MDKIFFIILGVFTLSSLFIYNNKIIALLNILQLLASVIYLFFYSKEQMEFYFPWLILFLCFLIISISSYYLSFISSRQIGGYGWFNFLLALFLFYVFYNFAPNIIFGIKESVSLISFKIELLSILIIMFSFFVILFCSLLLLKGISKNGGNK